VIGSGVYSIKDKEGVKTKRRGFNFTDKVDFTRPDTLTGAGSHLEIKVKAHFSLARALIQNDPDKMNLILDENRDLDLNFDKRRFWHGKFDHYLDLTKKTLDSDPFDYDMIRLNI
jgi:hypothetical protein